MIHHLYIALCSSLKVNFLPIDQNFQHQVGTCVIFIEKEHMHNKNSNNVRGYVGVF